MKPVRVKPITGRHVFFVICAFFSLIIVANAGLAFIAARSWTGLVVSNSYVAGRQFNQKLEDARRQNALNVETGIGYRQNKLIVTFSEKQAKSSRAPLISEVVAEIGRPSYENRDKMLTLDQRDATTFEAEVDLGKGVWIVSLRADLDGVPFYQKARLVVLNSGSGVLQ